MFARRYTVLSLGFCILVGCNRQSDDMPAKNSHTTANSDPAVAKVQLTDFQKTVQQNLENQIGAGITYVDAYYSGGSPPANAGVCTDVVARSFKAAGVDLRELVDQDMKKSPAAYGHQTTDKNIDYRRCKNLIIYFRRHGVSLPSANDPSSWQPGDIIFYDTGSRGYTDHVAVLSSHIGQSGNLKIVQAWPQTTVKEVDLLFAHKIVGHFRYRHRSNS